MTLKNRYFLLRHGQTNYQEMGLSYPWPDSSKAHLTKQGRMDIAKVAKNLKKTKIDLIFSSDLFRTRETAQIVASALGLKIIFDKRLRDENRGIYQGKPKEDYYRDFPLEKRFFQKAPKGNCWNDTKRDVVNFFKDIEKRYNKKSILLVAHGAPLWLLEGFLKKYNHNQLLDIIRQKTYIKMGELREIPR